MENNTQGSAHYYTKLPNTLSVTTSLIDKKIRLLKQVKPESDVIEMYQEWKASPSSFNTLVDIVSLAQEELIEYVH